MYLGVLYPLPDGVFILSGKSIKSSKKWRIRYARSRAAIEEVVEDLRSMSYESQEHARPVIPKAIEHCLELAAQVHEEERTLPDIDYRGFQGQPAYWLHAFLHSALGYGPELDCDPILADAKIRKNIVMCKPPAQNFGICGWTTGTVAEVALFFSRSQGQAVITDIPQHPGNEKQSAYRSIQRYDLPETSVHAAVRFSGQAASMITEALRRASGMLP